MAAPLRATTSAVDLDDFDAMLFDLDGVITGTATVHAVAWKALLDEFLRAWSDAHGVPFVPFDPSIDYSRYVDGRRRYDGVATFLRSRGIDLPTGAPTDAPGMGTISALGNKKDGYFNTALDRHGVEVFDDTLCLVQALRESDTAIAVVSASENCEAILRRAGIDELFPVKVTGVDANVLHLPGKPAPDTFLEAARRLDVGPPEAVVFEDALSGVEAGRAGGFGLVVGVDRVGGDHGRDLADHGADVVVTDLRTLIPKRR